MEKQLWVIYTRSTIIMNGYPLYASQYNQHKESHNNKMTQNITKIPQQIRSNYKLEFIFGYKQGNIIHFGYGHTITSLPSIKSTVSI